MLVKSAIVASCVLCFEKKRKKLSAIPRIKSDENRSRFTSAEAMQKKIISRDIASKEIPPTNPNSSAKVVKIKSVCFSGRKFRRLWGPCINPRPVHPPDPSAILDWVM